MENAKIEKLKCDIFDDFQTLCLACRLKSTAGYALQSDDASIFTPVYAKPSSTCASLILSLPCQTWTFLDLKET